MRWTSTKSASQIQYWSIWQLMDLPTKPTPMLARNQVLSRARKKQSIKNIMRGKAEMQRTNSTTPTLSSQTQRTKRRMLRAPGSWLKHPERRWDWDKQRWNNKENYVHQHHMCKTNRQNFNNKSEERITAGKTITQKVDSRNSLVRKRNVNGDRKKQTETVKKNFEHTGKKRRNSEVPM